MVELGLETFPLLSLQCPCFVYKSQCNVQYLWLAIKLSCVKGLQHFPGGIRGQGEEWVELQARRGSLKYSGKSRRNGYVEHGRLQSWLSDFNVLLIEKGPSVFLQKFPFSLALEHGWGRKKLPSVLVLQCISHPADFGCPALKAYLILVRCFNYMTCCQGLLTSLCIGVALLHQRGGPSAWLGSQANG